MKGVEIFKKNKQLTAVLTFCAAAIVLMLVATIVLQEFIVSVCILIVLEAGMAACLHNAEVWKHGLALAVQLIVGIVLARIPLVIVCMIAYVAATMALQGMNEDA